MWLCLNEALRKPYESLTRALTVPVQSLNRVLKQVWLCLNDCAVAERAGARSVASSLTLLLTLLLTFCQQTGASGVYYCLLLMILLHC